jgi:hypothetical protein
MQLESERLRPLIRRVLIDKLIANPNMTFDRMRMSIEEQIEGGL